MSRFFKFKLNRMLSRKEKRPVRSGAWRYNKQRTIRSCKAMTLRVVFCKRRYNPGTGVVARLRYKSFMEDC